MEEAHHTSSHIKHISVRRNQAPTQSTTMLPSSSTTQHGTSVDLDTAYAPLTRTYYTTTTRYTRDETSRGDESTLKEKIADVICSIRLLVIDTLARPVSTKTSWPSGLRRHVKAVVFTGGDPARHPELSIIKCSGRELTNRSFACGVAVLSPLSDS
eukprot:scaffold1928_cov109-Alexandrium_tamarense.AAC.25